MNLLKLKTCLDIFLEETKKTDARNANYISELYSFIWLANQNKINNIVLSIEMYFLKCIFLMFSLCSVKFLKIK